MESMHCPGKKYCKDTGFVVPCIYKRVLYCCRETGRTSCLIQKMHQATVRGFDITKWFCMAWCP